MSTDLSAHDVLVRAKEVLLRQGWTQDVYGLRRGGPRCLLGAVGQVWFGEDDFLALREFEEVRALGQFFGWDDDMPEWNDAPERTFGDVVAVLDAGIIATAPAETPVEALA